MRALILTIAVCLIGCGKEDAGTNSATWPNFSVTTASELPTCAGEVLGRLYYIEDTTSFQACKTTGWTAISIQGPAGTAGPTGSAGTSGANIASRWTFHVDTFVGQTNIGSEAAGIVVRLGDVRLVKFVDGSSAIIAVGNFVDADSVGDFYTFDFSHTFYLPSTTSSETAVIFKLNSYANMRIRYNVNPAATTPTFKAVVDSDGNFANNTDTTYTLTAE